MKETILKESIEYMKKNYNSNFDLDRNDWVTREWIKCICLKVEERLSAIEKDIEEKTIF